MADVNEDTHTEPPADPSDTPAADDGLTETSQPADTADTVETAETVEVEEEENKTSEADEKSSAAVLLRNNGGATAADVEERRWTSLLPEWMNLGRRKTLSELLATEERYVADLKALVDGYLNRLPAEVSLAVS
jgi:hypothetical protein